MNPVDCLCLEEISPSLDRLEAQLRKSAGADDPFLSEVARHLITAGGKRLRPILCIAAALACGGTPTDEVILGGVAVELVHLASLYHDDVMDEATDRRGVPSVNSRWGNNIAVVSGDFLLARAAAIAAHLGTEVARLLADTLAKLCEGQIIECQSIFDLSRTEELYFSAVLGKTSSLMATSCRIGAIVSGASPSEIEKVTLFGEHFGTAFQILDDILDVVGDQKEIGKLVGQDLAEGIYTLPTIRALETPMVSDQLKIILGKPLSNQERVSAQQLVASSDAITYASRIANEYISKAIDQLTGIREREVVEGLIRMSNQMIAQTTKNMQSAGAA